MMLTSPTTYHGCNVEDLSTPMYFVRHDSVVLTGFSGALGCLVALSTKTSETNACEKCLKVGGDTYDKNEP